MDAFSFKYSIITSATYLTLVLKFKSTKTEINMNVHTINAVYFVNAVYSTDIYCITEVKYVVTNQLKVARYRTSHFFSHEREST